MNEAQKALDTCHDNSQLFVYAAINATKSESMILPGDCLSLIYTFQDKSIIKFILKDETTVLQAESFENHEELLNASEHPHIE